MTETSTKKKDSRKLGDITDKISIFVDKYNYIIHVKNDKGHVNSILYFPDLKGCLTELVDTFVIENIPHLTELKQLDEKIDNVKASITRFCKKLEDMGINQKNLSSGLK